MSLVGKPAPGGGSSGRPGNLGVSGRFDCVGGDWLFRGHRRRGYPYGRRRTYSNLAAESI